MYPNSSCDFKAQRQYVTDTTSNLTMFICSYLLTYLSVSLSLFRVQTISSRHRRSRLFRRPERSSLERRVPHLLCFPPGAETPPRLLLFIAARSYCSCEAAAGRQAGYPSIDSAAVSSPRQCGAAVPFRCRGFSFPLPLHTKVSHDTYPPRRGVEGFFPPRRCHHPEVVHPARYDSALPTRLSLITS
jgi:hypothetical protein